MELTKEYATALDGILECLLIGELEYDELIKGIQKTINDFDFEIMVSLLKDDGLINSLHRDGKRYFYITQKGKPFINFGGFTRQCNLDENSTKAVEMADDSRYWAIVAAIVSIVGVLFALYVHYLSPRK
jgi:hypothetical protein